MGSETYTLRIQHILEGFSRIKRFRLALEKGKIPFEFLPGQHMGVRPCGTDRDKKNDVKTPWRHFSLTSSPQERNFVEIAVLKQGGASERMHRLSPGGFVHVTRPQGDFVLQEPLGYGPVFFAAGIGAAPVRSMVRYCLDKNLAEFITLFLCNSTPEESVFLEDFQQWARQNPRFSLWTHFTRTPSIGPDGNSKKNMFWFRKQLENRIEKPRERTYYLCVPRGLREKVEAELEQMGVVQETIHKEIW